MRSFLSIVTAPALCLSLLGGLAWENRRHIRPEEADPYHVAAKQAIDGWKRQFGRWNGIEQNNHIPQAAQNLLRPNALQYHVYQRTAAASQGVPAFMRMLIIQCRTPSDMSGHYPLNCYPSNGKALVGNAIPRTWSVPGLAEPVKGMEYHFRSDEALNADRLVVYDFFVLPGRGICADMESVRQATGDYQFKHYGAAQMQVEFISSGTDQRGRDEAFIELLAANADRIRSLNPPELLH